MPGYAPGVSTNVKIGRPNFGETHQALGLAIAFRTRHPEVARGALLRVTALLVTDHHARMAAEAREAADDRHVVRECAVAVQLVKIGKQFRNVIERVRTLRMPRDLRDLPRRQVRVEVFRQLLAFLRQPLDFFRNVDSRVVLHESQLFDLGLEFGDRLFEIQKRGLHVFESLGLAAARILPARATLKTGSQLLMFKTR